MQWLYLPKFKAMLQVNVLRQNAEWVKERLAVKNFKQPELVDAIIALDDERKRIQVSYDNTQAQINAASKEIGMLMAKGSQKTSS